MQLIASLVLLLLFNTHELSLALHRKSTLTTAQIIQFIVVFITIVIFIVLRYTGSVCRADETIMWITQLINTMFLVLFVKFYIDAYQNKKGSKSRANDKKKN